MTGARAGRPDVEGWRAFHTEYGRWPIIQQNEFGALVAYVEACEKVIEAARIVRDGHKRCPEWRTEHFCEWSGCGEDVYALDDAFALLPEAPR